MASSSSKRKRRYDVFLNFRGIDVRNNFLSHLYTALNQMGIYTYIDSEEMEKGEQITPALMEAIKESQIAITVFSKNYASSPWCLEELTEIMKRRQKKELIVRPVFYKVEPREVRTPRETYKEAMAMHEVKFRNDPEKVKRWNEALYDAGSLSGSYLSDGNEAELIQHIVQEVSTQLNRMPLDVAKYPVGIDSRVKELKTMLNLKSKNDVLMVGLLGQGGVGKTTLAKAIYNDVFREFQGSSFLEGVREKSKNSKNINDLVPLQEKMLSEVLLGKKFEIFSVGGGNLLIQARLCKKKVLIILDDVDDECQLNALAKDREWFAKGSRIIITTRDKRLLINHGVDHIYEVKVLKDGEALELFEKHAFQRNQKIKIRSNLVDSVLRYAKNLPLALKVLGSFLCGRGEHEWESTLQRLTKTIEKKIDDVLKVSYDGLENDAQEIFLDIACFFKGQRIEHIKKVLDSCCGFDTTILVQILIERSLISEEKGSLQMHDLIQLMGMNIVKDESHEDPSQRSRLWLYDDVLDVLSRDVGIVAIKAIVLKLPEPEDVHICPSAVTNMRNLRLLVLHNVDNSLQGPIQLPNQLKWLEWPNCAAIPEFSNGQKKLVGLDLQNGNIKEVIKQFKDFKNLTFINLSRCQSLTCMPDLQCTPNLKELNLHGCTNLEHFPNVLQSENLQLLNLNDCSKLQIFPTISNKIRSLQELYLRRTSIKELPASIKNLISLKIMELDDCKKLTILPSSIYKLRKIAKLTLAGCSKLIRFPKMEEDCNDPHTKIGFPSLEELDLSGCNLSEVEFLENRSCFHSLYSLLLLGNNFTSLPTCEQLYNLLELDVSFCRQLQEILKIPKQLKALNAYGCESLSKIPSDICDVDFISFELCHELVRNGLTFYNLFKLENFHPETGNRNLLLPGGDMPEWLVPNKEGYISFMASKDLYKKFLCLAFCVVLRGKVNEDVKFEIAPWANGRLTRKPFVLLNLDKDHVWLQCCEPRELWGEDAFGLNDPSHFQFSIRALDGGIVKKCGFRLICKPLENDLEVLLQHNQLLDPNLIYMVQHEETRTSTVEESSSESEDLQDSKTNTTEDISSKSVHKGSNVADFSIEKYRYSRISREYQNVRLGGEMPKEFVLVEDGTISFRASQDLYDKLLGVVLCVVLGVEDGKKEISFDIVPHFNNQRRNVLLGTLGSFDLNHMWIQYLRPNVLWGILEGGVDFGQFNERYLQFNLTLRISGGIVKKLGYVLRCRQLEDDLKAVVENGQLVVSKALCEDSDSEEDTFSDCLPLSRAYLCKCHMHIEELEASDNETD